MSTIIDHVKKIRTPKPKYAILQELSERFSPRHYSNEEIPLADINRIFEAARWAPSGYNAQPWYFYWTKNNSRTFETLVTALPKFNVWAQTASVLVVACYIKRGEKGHNTFAVYDLGAAVLALVLQAKNLGYYARQMGVFSKKKVKHIIRSKENEQPYVILALGKLGDYTRASRDIVQRDLTPTPRKTDVAKMI